MAPVRGYRGTLPAKRFNMARYCLAAPARAYPHKPALIVITDAANPEAAEIWSYEQLQSAVLRLGTALTRLGLQHGDRLMIRLDNSSAYAMLFFAAVAVGLVPLPASSQLTGEEASFLLTDSQSRALAIGPGMTMAAIPSGILVIEEDWIARAMRGDTRGDYADTDADDPAYLIYTSGTTARPKGVLHAHRAAWGRRPMYDGWYGIGPDDRMLHAGAFNWTYTLGTGLTDPWANGATAIVYTGEKDPALWPRLIRQHGASLFAAVPSLYRQILRYGAAETVRGTPFRHGLTAGEPLTEWIADTWRERTGTALYEALGMSEISTYISSSPTVPRRAGRVGKPQPGRSVAVLAADGGEEPLGPGEVGLLAVHRSDPALMLGYWHRPEEEAEVYRGDWFVGGDLAAFDAEGYVTHHGRANELMKAQGYRVSPLEIEAVLAAHPAVSDVACAELAVRADVSVIAAFIVPREGSAPQPDALLNFAARRLAPYKCPREIVFVQTLPRTANGKVMRRLLPELAKPRP
jgi:acyl-coenzyme A synthetase/AMP-(fatty) acid ligase